MLRSPGTRGRLILAFFGVEQLRFQTDGYFPFYLNITSIRDRHWERLKYIVHEEEEEEDTLRFYCERFEAAMQGGGSISARTLCGQQHHAVWHSSYEHVSPSVDSPDTP